MCVAQLPISPVPIILCSEPIPAIPPVPDIPPVPVPPVLVPVPSSVLVPSNLPLLSESVLIRIMPGVLFIPSPKYGTTLQKLLFHF